MPTPTDQDTRRWSRAGFARRGLWAMGAGAITGLVLTALVPGAGLTPASAAHDIALTHLADAPSWPEELSAAEMHAAKKSAEAPRTETRLVRYGLTFFNSHSKEILPIPVELDADGNRVADLVSAVPDDALASFLRCRVTQNEHAMARVPAEVAVAMARRFERRRINVVSGFRSPKFNLARRKKGHEVARASYHMVGEALDFRLPGISARDLAEAVMETHRGGVGRYDNSGFVHVDIGPRRDWRGR